MALFIGAMVWQQVGSTNQSVREEVVAANQVATRLLTRVSHVYQSSGLEGMTQFLEDLGRVRANDVFLYDAAGARIYASPAPTYKSGRSVPQWYARLVSPPAQTQEIHVAGGRLVIQSDSSRAVLDGWDDLVRLLWVGGAAFAMTIAVALWLTSRLMREAFHRTARALAEGAAARERAEDAGRRLEENRELTRTIQQHVEEERRSIARELHDELGQSITAVKSIGLAIARRSADRDPETEASARLIVQTAGDMYDAVQELIPRLRPFSLDSFGLAEALADLVGQSRVSHPQVQLRLTVSDALPALDDATATCAYRIVQESLSNALRHAAPRHVDIAVYAGTNALHVQVDDDGTGLAPGWEDTRHHGMRGMRERAAALGGRFDLAPRPGGGTRAETVLPLRKAVSV